MQDPLFVTKLYVLYCLHVHVLHNVYIPTGPGSWPYMQRNEGCGKHSLGMWEGLYAAGWEGLGGGGVDCFTM